MSFHPAIRLALPLLVVGVALLGAFFHRRQNARRSLGGRISPAKAAWLTFAVLFWLGVCPLLALDPALPTRWRWVLGLFAAQFWLRALVELWMLYVSKSWRPPYGIAHDAFSIGVVGGAALLAPGAWTGGLGDLVGLGATLVLLASLVAETGYAVAFHRLVEGRTTGEDGVWFADGEDPRFSTLNRITAAVNVPLWAGLAALVLAVLAGPALGRGPAPDAGRAPTAAPDEAARRTPCTCSTAADTCPASPVNTRRNAPPKKNQRATRTDGGSTNTCNRRRRLRQERRRRRSLRSRGKGAARLRLFGG